MKIKKITSILLIFIFSLFPLLSSCGGAENENPAPDADVAGGQSENADEPAKPEAEEYEYPDADYGGAKFIILNNEPIWDFTTFIVPEAQTGDALNDAMWARNGTVNEKFNVALEERTIDINAVTQTLRRVVQADTQDFDAVFCPGSTESLTVGTLVSEGLLQNLNNIPELRLTSPWWSQKILEDAKIGSNSAVYFASNEISIHALQCPWVIYFNEDMFVDLGLERPYQSVRDGKWTLDQMEAYMKAAATLNSDESYSPYKNSGTCIYGLSTAIPALGEMFRGLDVAYVGKDSGNMPIFTAGDPRFMDAAQKLADILAPPGMYTNGGSTHYERVFINGRALFCYAEFKAGTVYRDSETTFGIIPSPKLDENQPNYVHNMTQQAPVFIIPISTPDTAKTANVIDALSYLSHKDVTPVFFGVHMSQKELRNEESVEMLQLIRDTSIFDIGRIYSWSNTINQDTYNSISKGGGNFASIIERHEEKIKGAIEKTIEDLEN